MQVLGVNRSPSDCINVEIGYEESLTMALPGEKSMHQAVLQAIQLVQSLMSPTMLTRRVIKAMLCLSEEEYETLQKPSVGDEVELNVSPDGVVTIRFIKR